MLKVWCPDHLLTINEVREIYSVNVLPTQQRASAEHQYYTTNLDVPLESPASHG
jgi:hypothetical protein